MAQSKKRKSANSRQKSKKKSQISDSLLKPLISIIAGILLLLFLFMSPEAPVNGFFKELMLGLFGKPAVIVPILLIEVGIYGFRTRSSIRMRMLFAFLCTWCISAFYHLISTGEVISVVESYTAASYRIFSLSVGGGVVGAILACPLAYLVHKAVAAIIIILMLLGFISLYTGHSVYSSIFGLIKGMFGGIKETADKIDSRKDYEKAYNHSKKKTAKKMSARSAREDNYEENLIQEAVGFMEENKSRKSKSGKKQKQEAEEPKEIIKETKETVFDGNGIDEIFGKFFSDKEEPELKKEEVTVEEPIEEIAEAPEVDDEHSEPAKQKEKNLTVAEQEIYNKEIEESMAEPVREYVFPGTDLLNKPRNAVGDSRQQMYETSNKLIAILDNFGVKAKLLQVTQGPSVTRYEIQPNTGVKLSKIVGLADDLALNLAVPTVLVAAVPGKAAVGIEVPNRETAAVTARELIESDEFKKSKSKLTVALGRDIGGRVVVGDIAKMPHVLIAGATGSGKSVCINTIITSLLYKSSPDEVKLIMVDPKVVELGVYNGIPHLLIPVVTEPKKAAGALNWAVAEMMRRYDIFAQNYVKNLESYNQLMAKNGGDKLPQIVIVIDELADLMMVAAKEVEDYICRLAQLARAAGLHLIVATQRPTADVITGLIKANIPSRIAFAVASNTDSRVILDKGGADKLLGKGDMLYAPQGSRSPVRVQGAYVSDDEIERLLDFLKAQNEDAHYSEDLEEHIERVSTGENGVTPDADDDGDELLPQAIELAVELGQISTAMIQRRLKVGYSRAGRIIDQLEERGVIGPANGSKPRQVYISHADL